MIIERRELKQQAKQVMRGVRPSPYWVSLLMMVIGLILTVLSMSLNGSLAAYRTMYEAAMQGRLVYVEPQAVGGGIGWLLNLALDVMSWVIGVGFVIYAMRLWRREQGSVGNLFDGFGVFFRSVWIQLLPGLFMTAWSLLYVMPVSAMIAMTGQVWWAVIGLPLLIPAVKAYFSYRLATYMMLDNPGLTCMQCIAFSREVMNGHKIEAFKLELSFIGWYLLGALIPVAGLLVIVWVNIYYQTVFAGYYDNLMADYMARSAPPVDMPPAY